MLTGDVTLDATPAVLSANAATSDTGDLPECCARVAVVEGSGPHLTGEIELVLRARLRIAASLMTIGFVAFLPLHYWHADFSQPGRVFLFVFHLMVVAALGTFAGLLYGRGRMSVRGLRSAELSMFAVAAAFYAALQYITIRAQCQEMCRIREFTDCSHVKLTVPAGLWLFLLFTYALFVPNTCRRAMIVIGSLAATPVVMVILMVLLHPEVREVMPIDAVVSFAVIMTMAAVTGIFGVDSIGSLRREAFEARQLGQYRLTKRIGAGGMGEVYLAEHQMLKRDCAIKLIRPGKAADPKALARFQREVRATAKLSHWNTVEIFDYGNTEDGTFYYVMEYLPGMSLADIVERFGPLPPARVVHLLRQVCDALTEAHAAGLIHRDIKPGNVFAARRGGVDDVAKLLDFGLVKPLIEVDHTAPQLTAEGTITGTPWFMSPEQATGDGHADARSDVYSLAAVGYYLLTGRPPFGGTSALKVVIALAHDEVVPPSQHVEIIPADLEQVILRALAKSPDDRFPSAADMGQALSECELADRWTPAKAATWWRRTEQTAEEEEPSAVT